MTDLAKLASKIVAGIKTDTTDESIIALQLRALWDEAQTKAIKDAAEQLIKLEVRGEVTLSEAEKWREMLYLGKPA